jgi:hypothetical protein
VVASWLWLQLLRSNMKLSFIDMLMMQHGLLVHFYIITSSDEGILPPHGVSTVLLLCRGGPKKSWVGAEILENFEETIMDGIHLQYARGHFVHCLITSRLILEFRITPTSKGYIYTKLTWFIMLYAAEYLWGISSFSLFSTVNCLIDPPYVLA